MAAALPQQAPVLSADQALALHHSDLQDLAVVDLHQDLS